MTSSKIEENEGEFIPGLPVEEFDGSTRFFLILAKNWLSFYNRCTQPLVRRPPTFKRASSTYHSYGHLVLPVEQIKHSIAQARPDNPPQARKPDRRQPHGHERVERYLARQGVPRARRQHDGAAGAAPHGHEGREGDLPPPPGLAQLEEGVPVQGRHVGVGPGVRLGAQRRAGGRRRVVGRVVGRRRGVPLRRRRRCWLAGARCEDGGLGRRGGGCDGRVGAARDVAGAAAEEEEGRLQAAAPSDAGAQHRGRRACDHCFLLCDVCRLLCRLLPMFLFPISGLARGAMAQLDRASAVERVCAFSCREDG